MSNDEKEYVRDAIRLHLLRTVEFNKKYKSKDKHYYIRAYYAIIGTFKQNRTLTTCVK